MIAYHWSPTTNRASITKRGLQIGRKPTVTEAFRNSHISVCRTPLQAWKLSGEFMTLQRIKLGEEYGDVPDLWDLWEVDLKDIRYRTIPRWIEIQVTQHIPRRAVRYVATRVTS